MLIVEALVTLLVGVALRVVWVAAGAQKILSGVPADGVRAARIFGAGSIRQLGTVTQL